ncbi:MAG: GntG family PLP-dependent aldolase [Planctomycetota bacterium]|nr:GntG family PLP-dependent aldolase [Planctomycetota bacterium]
MNHPIDLRSDTVTRPTAAMRRAMAKAEVGDDMFGDDPTVARLEARVCALTGMEAAVFVPSGTMANQLAIRAQTKPGDEIICHPESHIVHYETGAPAALSGVTTRFADGPRGTFAPDAVRALVRPDDQHFAATSLVCMENTHNRGRGKVWPTDQLHAVIDAAHSLDLRAHVDGARLWNASVASGVAVREILGNADSVSVCFSKGLGAPVGSALASDAATIKHARRFRKMFGGAMRQAGVLAAAALYALDHHVERLADDHANARLLAERLAEVPGFAVNPDQVETNLVYFAVVPALGTAAEVCGRLEAEGVLVLPEGEQTIRAVTHLDVTGEAIKRAAESVVRLLGR